MSKRVPDRCIPSGAVVSQQPSVSANQILRGECPICTWLWPGTIRLVQDHCHVTGLLRDRICDSCNVCLGYLEKKPRGPHCYWHPNEDLETLDRARFAYIAKWREAHKRGGIDWREFNRARSKQYRDRQKHPLVAAA